ncbi:hypothetical protein BC937DRAFT_94582 [Endogone sp. FLAS-F59071]|nr:hypothetical protein BC937DRAFT_94582 [Endogone sp. FLAS-F59071]|eukprot:RUS13934.1 hypothetical protein BC937DRAFT_94582 [Endogone sp. FLAS-F59071]
MLSKDRQTRPEKSKVGGKENWQRRTACFRSVLIAKSACDYRTTFSLPDRNSNGRCHRLMAMLYPVFSFPSTHIGRLTRSTIAIVKPRSIMLRPRFP